MKDLFDKSLPKPDDSLKEIVQDAGSRPGCF